LKNIFTIELQDCILSNYTSHSELLQEEKKYLKKAPKATTIKQFVVRE